MQKFIDNVQDSEGNAISYATVLVTDNAGNKAVIYSDNVGTVTPNPTTADIDGMFSFYAPGGRYTLTITSPHIQTITILDILIEDLLYQNNIWEAGQSALFTALSIASNLIAVNLALSNNFNLTMTANATLSAPSNVTAGQSGFIEFNQGASNKYTLAFNSFWKFPGGSVPTLTATNAAKDILSYTVNASGTSATCVMLGDIK